MTLFSEAIFTPRLKIRKICMEDLSQVVAWSNAEEAHGNYLTPEKMTEQTCLERLQSGTFWTAKNKCFMIEPRNGDPIGTIHYWLRPEREECAVAQLKIAEPQQRGKGFGTEAQKYLIINLFERAKVKEIEMYTDVNNMAQQRCLTKLGFELIESLSYEDHQVPRFGHLYRLRENRFQEYPVFHYHYE